MPSLDTATREAVAAHVKAALADVLEEQGVDAGAPSDDTRLIGDGAPLDSLALVTLMVDLEDRLRAAYRTDISFTHDRALSQTRSPFRTVGSLADYATELLNAGRTPS